MISRHQVFAGIYPVESNDFPKLEESIKRVQWFVEFKSVTTYNFANSLR